MPLAAGTQLGPYQILAPVEGSNGSEVYKATDSRASRTVDLHVLPPETKARFEREASALTSLKHPNICTPEEIGHEDGVDFFVTELLEGPTLAERLAGRTMNLDEAMTIAIAIAGALDKAHGAGLVHHDLKPSSVVLTQAGAKLTGFGLAEAGPPKEGLDFGYMSPEQVNGKPSDARGDIFSFGAMLYEMLAGKKAFEGKSRAVLIAAISTAEPDALSQARPGMPPMLEHIVERCLAKDPEVRWQTAHDLLVQLRWTTEGGVAGAGSGFSLRTKIALAAAAVLVAALAYPAAMYFRGPGDAEPLHFRVPVRGLNTAGISVSPDGQTMALVVRTNLQERPALYLRGVGALAFQKLGGTDDAEQPFWSPDSRFIGFVAGGRLKKVGVAGGAPQDVTGEAQGFSGGAWSRDGVILFGSSKGLMRVSAEGGKAEPVTAIDPKETGHFWPSFLPDGRHFLYLAWSGQNANRAVFVGALDSKDKTKLLTAESNAVYADPGYVVFHRDASLFAQQFDADRLTLSGEPIHVADEVAASPANGRGNFDVSQNGVLIYFQGGQASTGRAQTIQNRQFGWVNRSGSVTSGAGEAGPYGDVDLSPDGKLIAATRQETGAPGADIWVIDWQRAGVATRLTLDPEDDINPVWSPDGKQIAFTTYRKGNADIYVKNANGVGPESPLLESQADELIEDWSKDGRYIAYLTGPQDSRDIFVLPLSGEKKEPFPVVQGRFQKDEAQFSYDGKWLAYISNESGMFQVYVVSFPAGDRIQVSLAGGGQPRWRQDGKELYYRAADNRIMAVDLKTGGKLESSPPRILFTPQVNAVASRDPQRHMLSVTPDGQRFLIAIPPGAANAGGGGGSVPQAQATAVQQGGPGAVGTPQPGPTTNGLAVIRHWTGLLGKEQK